MREETRRLKPVTRRNAVAGFGEAPRGVNNAKALFQADTTLYKNWLAEASQHDFL